ncbi:NAD-dependent protein deacylase [Xiamenia xianingshaonis]|uniref:NAD-dependent protein deacetylase n=1 Tax=Xiamenia xianingshaonis TaxID=2682776 RepID=A0A9E6MRG2_9ACTN|nr:NAD-dependent protein deacylase [Xiamenia xianingshaonis]NHM13710.1 NAD-dependent protein deacylase [Xiamenia xianingshaonis]QTU85079.1 NAD-dependent protein deacylase [Xiamenia xianingshaonis]
MESHPLSPQDEQSIETLRRWIGACKPGRMTFFGGAGVSTESGIPDFRSSNGLFKQQFDYPPETIVSRTFFLEHPHKFYDFYCERMIFLDARPNQAHHKLAELERQGVCQAVVTQNIDGLHQSAGSRNVVELHGSVHRNHCVECGRFFSVDDVLRGHADAADGVPRCPCGGVVKPDVVLYEEPLDEAAIEAAISAIETSDVLVVGGTSLNVYPAAGLLRCFRGEHLAIVNLAPTPLDRQADLCIAAPLGKAFDF